MATTTRKRKKKKKTVKKSPVLPPISVQKQDVLLATNEELHTPMVLEPGDLRQIENLSKDVQIAQKDMAIEEQSLVNLQLQFKLLEHNIVQQREVVRQRADSYESRKVKYATFKKGINPKYGLAENESLGYNPETGAIIK